MSENNDWNRARQVVQRVRRDIKALDKHDTISLMMDLDSVPDLDLLALLESDKFTFSHDVCGIVQHMDRSTYPGKLMDCFVPRCTRKVTTGATL
jgi:hypothetical protein